MYFASFRQEGERSSKWPRKILPNKKKKVTIAVSNQRDVVAHIDKRISFVDFLSHYAIKRLNKTLHLVLCADAHAAPFFLLIVPNANEIALLLQLR